MSRVAKMPVKIPAGVQITADAGRVTVKGAKTSLALTLPSGVSIEIGNGEVKLSEGSIKTRTMQSGTVRALLNNMVTGTGTRLFQYRRRRVD